MSEILDPRILPFRSSVSQMFCVLMWFYDVHTWKILSLYFLHLRNALLKIAQTIGMCILFFIALPELSPAEGAIITAGLLLKCFIDARKKRIWIDVFAVSCQFGTLILWVALRSYHSQIWSLLQGLFMTSLGWWATWLPEDNDDDENDDDGENGLFKKMRYLAKKCKVTKKKKHSLNQGGIAARILGSRFPGKH